VPYPRNFAWSEAANNNNSKTGIAAKSHADEPVEGDENVDWKKVSKFHKITNSSSYSTMHACVLHAQVQKARST
jgi:hypothetical protein